MTEQTFTAQGQDIDLDKLYRAMWDQAEDQGDGTRLFDGQKSGVRGIPKLLTDLFGIPEPMKKDDGEDAAKGAGKGAGKGPGPGKGGGGKGGARKAASKDPSDATRIECRDRLSALGWAVKREGTKAQYDLKRAA